MGKGRGALFIGTILRGKLEGVTGSGRLMVELRFVSVIEMVRLDCRSIRV